MRWSQLPHVPETTDADSFWPADEPVFASETCLNLSPTDVQTWVACPRRFFYRKGLHLPSFDSDETRLGSLVHRILETFHLRWAKNPQPEGFCLAALQAAMAEEMPSQSDDALHWRDICQQIQRALESLQQQGFFETPPVQAWPEQQVSEVTLPSIPRVRWSLRVDVLYQDAAGNYRVVDFKCYGPDKMAQKSATLRVKEAARVFEPLPLEAKTHAQRFQQGRFYPLPITWWVLQQQSTWAGQISQLALQLVRPPVPGKPEVGANLVALPLEALTTESAEGISPMAAFLQHLGQEVLAPILATGRFEENTGMHCQRCPYVNVCDAQKID
jgi:hypothetical protein